MADKHTVEQWGVFEATVKGRPKVSNPFTDVEFGARFTHKHLTVAVDGFYDGEGCWRVRFSPYEPGEWAYETFSSATELAGTSGRFVSTKPDPGNHGPVRVADTYHFAYADGTRYYPVGTTCYAWAHQGEAMEEQTLQTLRRAPFNKIRMCVFPKHYEYNANEPEYYPFEKKKGGGWDFARFAPPFWRHFEKRVGQLMEIGIEADIILFHPYDRWGFSAMDAASDDRYLRYAIARLAAYRNIWWSMANEYDVMSSKKAADWDRFFRIVQDDDPYQHLRSIHQCHTFYDHGKPWVTHASIQHGDVMRMKEWRAAYRKPIIDDECSYEGNIDQGWGNITAEELVRRFWIGVVSGGYVGHGETYLHPQDLLWWSKGGVLRGQSPPRIAFLRRLMEEGPPRGLDPVQWRWDTWGAGKGDEYFLIYYPDRQPAAAVLALPGGTKYQAEIIDTWAMTITAAPGTFSGASRIALPGRPCTALRLRKVTGYAATA